MHMLIKMFSSSTFNLHLSRYLHSQSPRPWPAQLAAIDWLAVGWRPWKPQLRHQQKPCQYMEERNGARSGRTAPAIQEDCIPSGNYIARANHGWLSWIKLYSWKQSVHNKQINEKMIITIKRLLDPAGHATNGDCDSSIILRPSSGLNISIHNKDPNTNTLTVNTITSDGETTIIKNSYDNKCVSCRASTKWR